MLLTHARVRIFPVAAPDTALGHGSVGCGIRISDPACGVQRFLRRRYKEKRRNGTHARQARLRAEDLPAPLRRHYRRQSNNLGYDNILVTFQ